MRFLKRPLLGVGTLVLLALTSVTGCFLKKVRAVSNVQTRITGPIGWYRVTPMLGVNWRGLATIPPRDPDDKNEAEDDDYDDEAPLDQRLRVRFARQLSALMLDADANCLSLVGVEAPLRGPVFIFVHGIGGVGAEWWAVVPTLAKLDPSAMFLFRWNATQTREVILESLVTGINRITACSPGVRVVVLAHSAGGVLLSFAASRLKVEQKVELLTCSSPLAGIGYHSKIDNDDDDTRFFNDLGSTKTGYTAAAPNVVVTHYRTQYPADHVMKPNVFGHSPNQRGIKVEGATEVDLPSDLTHDGALIYLAQQLARDAGVVLPSRP